MNIEFHYYALHYISRCAGFSQADASTIAISSQMVDECIAPWEVSISPLSGSSVHGGAGNGYAPLFHTYVTQNYIFWDEAVAKNIYRPFHFIPGDVGAASALRLDGHASRFVVTADSPLAREILIAALNTRNLYRIGLALHSYADTWAHQNFSGEAEAQNTMDASSPFPAAGHLQAMRNPDNPRLVWKDGRLKDSFKEIRNADRFVKAAAMIYRFLCTFNRRSFADEIFVTDRLEELWGGAKAVGDSAARASDYIIDFDVPPYTPEAWAMGAGGRTISPFSSPDPWRTGYDRLAWLKDAATKASSAFGGLRGRIPEAGYKGSAFEYWNKAVAEHRDFCFSLFKQRGIA